MTKARRFCMLLYYCNMVREILGFNMAEMK